jgi:Cd2+/Zn2+-exporting ATPase
MPKKFNKPQNNPRLKLEAEICPYCTEDILEEEKTNKVPLLIIIISAIILSFGLYFNFFLGWEMFSQTLFLLAAVISGYKTIIYGVSSLLKGRFTISILITIAAAGAFLIGEGAEGASVMFLYFIAEYLEDYASKRARKSLGSLVKLAPQTALVKRDGNNIPVHVHSVEVNEIVVVKPGEKIPLDGVVIKGLSSVDQAAITGESLSVNKSIGEDVYAGSINQEGYLEVKITKKSTDSVISRIIDLVKESKAKKSRTEVFIDRFSTYYTPIVIFTALIIAIIPPFVFGMSFDTWFYRALVLLVISCPCALAISTPVSMVSAITAGTRNGVLIKGGEYVEELAKTELMVFDKTGTLTEGRLEVTDVLSLNNYSDDQIIKIAGSLESQSKHPLAEAVVNYARERDVILEEVQGFEQIPGKGLKGKIEGKNYYIGAQSLFENISTLTLGLKDEIEIQGKTTIIIGDNHSVIGLIGLLDKIKDNSKETIHDLKTSNIKTIMLTGDNESTAHTVSSKIGLDEYYAKLMPEDKVRFVEEMLHKYKHVVMVGDGVNDAPALARSSVGIAMGVVGSDVAIETSDISLMQDDISKVNYLLNLSKKTMNIIKENVTLSIFIKVSFAVLAIFGYISLWMAVLIGDMGLSLLVILNALRIGIK